MLVNRNIQLRHGKTSMRLEQLYWDLWESILRREGMSPGQLVCLIDAERAKWPATMTRTEAVRVFITGYYAAAATEEGHARAQHGVLASRKIDADLTRRPLAA